MLLAAITANTRFCKIIVMRFKQEPILGTLREKKGCSSTGNRTKSRAFPLLKITSTLLNCSRQTHLLQAAAEVTFRPAQLQPHLEMQGTPPPAFHHISSATIHTQDKVPRPCQLSWEKERGSQTCFSFFCIFIIIKSGMNVISARHNTKKNSQ